MEWADNPFLPQAEIAAISETLSEEQLETRRYGRFKASGGLVYPEFDENVHVITPFDVPPDWQDAISIDPGLKNPLSAHWYAVDYDGTVYVVAEHFQAEKTVEYHAEKIKEISQKLGWKSGRDGRINAYIDSAANQRTLAATKSVTELFYERGINANPNVNKDLFSGIARVKAYLKPLSGKPRLYVFSDCINLIRELKNYRWGGGDAPKKFDDHALDELRYYVMTKPEGASPKRDKSLIAKDKERLFRVILNERKQKKY